MSDKRAASPPAVDILETLSGEVTRLEETLENLPVAWYEADASDRIVLASRPFTALVGESGVERSPVSAFYANPGERARILADARENGGASSAFVTLRSGVQVEEQVHYVDTPRGRLVQGVLRDVTEELAFQRELDRTARNLTGVNRRLTNQIRAMDVLTYGIGHDLRSPLRGIRAFARAVEEDLADADVDVPEDVQRHVAGIERHAARMQRMLRGLLELARFHRHAAEGEADTARILDEVLDTLASERRAEHVTVERGHLPVVPVADEYMKAVLQNLVANAMKYAAGDKPVVRVGASSTDGEWDFVVADSGPGIPDALRERVFEIFFRGRARDTEGTGVGLAVARLAVESWGGRIWIEDAPEGGAAFHFTVPNDPERVGVSNEE